MGTQSRSSEPGVQANQQWTPEFILQAAKEGVTALIGLTLVISLVILAWRT